MGGANANSTYFYTYLDAKYVKRRTSWRRLKLNNPFGPMELGSFGLIL